MTRRATEARRRRSGTGPGEAGEPGCGERSTRLTRRTLLGGASVGAAGVAFGAGAAGAAWAPGTVRPPDPAATAAVEPNEGVARHERAYRVRVRAAERMRARPLPGLPAMVDETRYGSRIGNFTKGLPHDALGEVNPFAYQALSQALETGRAADFEDIPMGGVAKLLNPQAGLAFDLVGPDSHQLSIPRPPAVASAETASEMGELYWQALLRDIPLTAYDDHPLAAAAAADLAAFSDFRGSVGGRLTPSTLFRFDAPGVADGPFVSQFLLRDLPTPGRVTSQQVMGGLPGEDHLTDYEEWRSVQDGGYPTAALLPTYDPTPHYVRNGRDLAWAFHTDLPGQAVLQACQIAFGVAGVEGGSVAGLVAGGARIPLHPSNPYLASRTQVGFGTFDLPNLAYLVAVAANCALKAAWYQKWFVHRRLRPEEYGGRVHHAVAATAEYPVHADLLAGSAVLDEVRRRFGSALLPQAYPEGAPIHPAYPSGHATWAGAAVTVAKAFLDEAAVIANPVVGSDDGIALVPYTGEDRDRLTVGGELNKLAWNIAIGRVFAGVHWRSDAVAGLRLGEEVALAILADLRATYNEHVDAVTLTRFDGATVAA